MPIPISKNPSSPVSLPLVNPHMENGPLPGSLTPAHVGAQLLYLGAMTADPTLLSDGVFRMWFRSDVNKLYGALGTVSYEILPGGNGSWPGFGSTPSASAPGDAASEGGGTTASKDTHVHARESYATLIANIPQHVIIDGVVDVTIVSTTVPYLLVGPMPAAGTITNLEAVAGDNKTNGATSAIFDVHKILAANVNTDGQGTTIFTTQGNRPTISNGNKKSTTTLPDVTTFAAGDYFAFYVDQAGTSLTVATIGIRATYP